MLRMTLSWTFAVAAFENRLNHQPFRRMYDPIANLDSPLVPPSLTDAFMTRREMLARSGSGFGLTALAALIGMGELPGIEVLGQDGGFSPLAPKKTHFAAKAKHIIQIFAQGAPTHIDTWDPKPELKRRDGQNISGRGRGGTAFGSPFDFAPTGQSGLQMSPVWPELRRHADRLAVVRSMHTDIPAHDTAQVMFNTGSLRRIMPSVGSWVLYGMGSDNESLPGFVALSNGNVNANNMRAAFLPGAFQGTQVNTNARRVEDLIANIRNRNISLPEQRRQLDLLHSLNEVHKQKMKKDGQLEARLQAYELAFKMQMEAIDAFDANKEPDSVQEEYGNTGTGRQMLIARRLVERGVRFVQVWHGGWDHHNNIAQNLPRKAGEIDRPFSALITDLERKGLLDETLILWGGEFGRTPAADGNAGGNPGRNHNSRAFSVVMAGGGIKGGMAYGATDELGGAAVEKKVHIHDLHATVLALMGFDHEKLTFRHNGRDFRLTDVYGKVVKDIIT